jgi:hypothetical protein
VAALAEGESGSSGLSNVNDEPQTPLFRNLPILCPREHRLRFRGGDAIGIFPKDFDDGFVEAETRLEIDAKVVIRSSTLPTACLYGIC